MELLVGLLIVLFGGAALGSSVTRARQNAWAGPRTPGMRRRAGRAARNGGQRSWRQELKLERGKARVTNWLEQQRHDRKNGTPPATVSAIRPQRTGQFPAASPAGGSAGQQRRRGRGAPVIIPARPTSAPAPTTSPNGRTTPVAANGSSSHAAEKLIEGTNQIHAEAATGGIHAKQGAVKASNEGSVRFASMASMLARQMSEPGQNYGPEITEPLQKASEHLQAAAMAFGEADANITTLINMTVGDLANSSRQAPHHTELSENGSR